MPRLRDTTTGSIVNVSEDTAKQLGSQYVAVDSEGEERPRRGRPRKTED